MPNSEGPKLKRLVIMLPGHYSNIIGGSQYQAKCILEELAKKNRYELYYLTRDSDPDYRPRHYRLITYDFPGKRKQGLHRHFFEMLMLPKLLQRIKPDIIYQRVGSAQTGIAAHYALKNHCKMIWHIAAEGDLDRSRIRLSRLIVYRIIERKLLHYGILHASGIIAQTDDQKKTLERKFGRLPSAVIPNLHPAPEEIIKKEDPIKVLWVANFKAVKQPEIFIRLASELRMLSNVQFIMVGAIQGAERLQQRYRKMIAQTDALSYLGPKTQSEVNSLMAQAHIFVNTSLMEGFPNTFIQAWMRQMPVVSLNVDPDGSIAQRQLGFVSGSFEKMKRDVALLVENAALRNEIGKSARIFATKNFSTRNVEKLIQIIDQP